jgi:hypothetical protein|tara:strand:+ start:894 stop:1124 length:231 start_codon:yes stop_codon:yes gene_type:complete
LLLTAVAPTIKTIKIFAQKAQDQNKKQGRAKNVILIVLHKFIFEFCVLNFQDFTFMEQKLFFDTAYMECDSIRFSG